MTTGILGGTFDPFHNGHLRVAIECREKLQLQSLRIIPLHMPPHRQAPVASAEQRLEMLTLAVKDHNFIRVDDSELQRRGVSYTIDTVKHVRSEISDEPMCLIMGSDAFNDLDSWYNWQELIDYTHIVVTGRPGKTSSANVTGLSEFIRRYRIEDAGELHTQPAGKLLVLDIPLLDISATRIRTIIMNNNDPSGLLPEKVIKYIYSHSLYQQEDA